MLINQATLNGMNTGFQTVFNKVFKSKVPLWQNVATLITSETSEESYKWLGRFPSIREWIGEREIQNLSVSDYTIKNKKFELTISVDSSDIHDDKIGIYIPLVSDIAQSAAEFPDKLVFNLLNTGFKNECYDKLPFFSENHKIGKNIVSNKSKKKLNVSSYIQARNTIMSMMDDHNRSLNIIPNILVVPPALESCAREILKADLIHGTTNVFKDTAEILVVPELSIESSAWYLLCTTKALKPLIYQEREKATFQSLISENDTNVFMLDKHLYGVRSRCAAGYGFWQMAYGSTGEED